VDALYMLSQSSKTCTSGPLISLVLPNSPFQDASPAIPPNSFLVSVDGVKLDKYAQGIKKEYVDEIVDFSVLMWMREGTGEEDIAFETCNAATGKVQKHKMSMAWSKDREGRGVQYVYDPLLDKVEWEIYGDLIFMALTENHITMFNGDFHSNAMIRFMEPGQRQKPRLAVMLRRSGGEAQEALSLNKGNDLEIVESINGHEVNTLDDYRRHFFPDPPKMKDTKAPSGIRLFELNATKNWPPDISIGSGAVPEDHQAFLSREREAVRRGEELVWSLKTAAGREYASLFVDTLRIQAAAYIHGARYVMTTAAKQSMKHLGFFAKKKSLLASARESAATELDIDAVEDLKGRPLEVKRREGGVAIVDFANNEGYDSW